MGGVDGARGESLWFERAIHARDHPLVMSFRVFKPLPILLLPLLLVGCLTSTNPFYLEGDIIQDERLIGVYPDENDKTLLISVGADVEHKGRYAVTVDDGPAWITYTGTLFKLGGLTFLDLYASSDSGVRRSGGGPPVPTAILHSLSFQPLHLLLKVTLGTNTISYAALDTRGLSNLVEHERSLVSKINGSALILPLPTADLRKLLLKYGADDNIFNSKATLKKRKQT